MMMCSRGIGVEFNCLKTGGGSYRGFFPILYSFEERRLETKIAHYRGRSRSRVCGFKAKGQVNEEE